MPLLRLGIRPWEHGLLTVGQMDDLTDYIDATDQDAARARAAARGAKGG